MTTEKVTTPATTGAEWTRDHPRVGETFSSVLPFYLLPPRTSLKGAYDTHSHSSKAQNLSCDGEIVAYSPENPTTRQPELFRVKFSVTRPLSDKIEGPLVPHLSSSNNNNINKDQVIYFIEDYTANDFPTSQTKRKSALLAQQEELLYQKRARYMVGVERAIRREMRSKIKPHIRAVVRAAVEELDWESRVTGLNTSSFTIPSIIDRIQAATRILQGLGKSVLTNVGKCYKIIGSFVALEIASIEDFASIPVKMWSDREIVTNALSMDPYKDFVQTSADATRPKYGLLKKSQRESWGNTVWPIWNLDIKVKAEEKHTETEKTATTTTKESKSDEVAAGSESDSDQLQRQRRSTRSGNNARQFYFEVDQNTSSRDMNDRILSSASLGAVSQKELAHTFGVPFNKVRRSLASLVLSGNLCRVWPPTNALSESEFNSNANTCALDLYIEKLKRTEATIQHLVIKTFFKSLYGEGATTCMDEDAKVDPLPEDSDFELSKEDYRIGCKLLRKNSVYQVESYAAAVPLEGADEDSKFVYRRRRFFCKLLSVLEDDETQDVEDSIYLTESQVTAGAEALVAYNLERSCKDSLTFDLRSHIGETCILAVGNKSVSAIVTAVGEEQRLFLLLEEELIIGSEVISHVNGELKDEVSLSFVVDGTPIDGAITWMDNSSSTDEAHSLVEALKSHPKAFLFLEPVDPVKLQCLDYFDTIKKPMDLSTVSKKLSKGKYTKKYTNEVDYNALKRDLDLIWSNAILFNGEESFVGQAASTMQKVTSRKLKATIQRVQDEKVEGSTGGLYYVPSSDEDDVEGIKSRVPKKLATQFVSQGATALIEAPQRLSSIVDALPISNDTKSFSLPKEWVVRVCKQLPKVLGFSKGQSMERTSRRLTQKRKAEESILESRQFYHSRESLAAFDRKEVESYIEKQHESYSELYKNSSVKSNDVFTDGFPPWLGRVVNGVWEIREPFVGPALRWVVRGLMNSEFVAEIDRVAHDAPGGGSIMLNCAYVLSKNPPFDALDDNPKKEKKELSGGGFLSKKKAEEEEDEETKQRKLAEMSDYERMRFERVQRNKERLKALGLL